MKKEDTRKMVMDVLERTMGFSARLNEINKLIGMAEKVRNAVSKHAAVWEFGLEDKTCPVDLYVQMREDTLEIYELRKICLDMQRVAERLCDDFNTQAVIEAFAEDRAYKRDKKEKLASKNCSAI